MMARGIRILPALLIPAVIAGAGILAGNAYVKKAEAEFAGNEAAMAEVQLAGVMEKLNQKDYSGMYAATQSIEPTLDSEEAYLARLGEVFADRDMTKVSCMLINETETQREYQLTDGDTLLGTMVLLKKDGTLQPAFALHGNESYRVEVPSGMTLKAGDTVVGTEYLVKKREEAANFFQVTDPTIIPAVDIYELTGLLGEPELNKEEGYSMIQDVLSKDWLLGKTVTDEKLKQELIDAAVLIAEYPARDASLASVQAVSDTSSRWYQKYVTLQNAWFTAHDKHSVSNEGIKAVQQSDDTIVSHIWFDYFADNGEVNRTWHVGYQLTFRKSGDKWIVCGTELNSLLNPAQPH